MAVCFGYYKIININNHRTVTAIKKGNKNKTVGGGRATLTDFCDWDVPTRQSFGNLLASYKATPTSKSVINSMIKFEDMYRDAKPGPFRTSFFTDLKGLNEERQGRRLKAYLAKRDLIRTVNSGGGKEIIATSRAHKIFYESYPLAKLRQQKWDGGWTVVTYDIPSLRKSDREYLRRKLKDLGFGCPQESLYVSPLHLEEPLQELIEGEGLGDFVWVISAQRILGLPNTTVAQKSWNLDSLNGLYSKLLEALPRVKKSGNKKLLKEWKEYFLSVDNADPYLPKELLSKDWLGEMCKNEFTKLGLSGLLLSIIGLG